MLALRLALISAAVTCSSCSPALAADGDLGTIIFSSVLFRHGDRSPTESYPTDPYDDVNKYWPRGYGQLSQIGEQQHYQLGKFLRKRYSDLLPREYNANDTRVRSTDVDRTLASALCNLAGLYPWLDSSDIPFQAVPVHTESSANDKLLKPESGCRKYSRLLELVRRSQEYQCVNDTTSQLQTQVAQFAGYSTFKNVIANILFIEELYNLTLPEWTKPYYPSPLTEIDVFQFFITSASTTELQRLSVGPLLKEMVDNMADKARGTLQPDRKLYMYSAHDTNIVNILQALHVFDGRIVPYAAAVIVELRRLAGSHYVTVSYKNDTDAEPRLLKMPGCESLCPLDQFVEITKPLIPDDEIAECSEEPAAGSQIHIQVPEAAILPEWQHCFENSPVKDGRVHVTFKK